MLAPPAASGRVAQLVEQLTLNQRVHGSSPCSPTKKINKISALHVNSNYNVCALKTINTYKLFCSLVMRFDAANE